MDPFTIYRIGRTRQQELLAWAARQDEQQRRRWTLRNLRARIVTTRTPNCNRASTLHHSPDDV